MMSWHWIGNFMMLVVFQHNIKSSIIEIICTVHTAWAPVTTKLENGKPVDQE